MKALIHTQFGPPDVLQIVEVEKPTPTDDQVLVNVQAVSLNPADYHLRRGIPLARFSGGLMRPKDTMLGADFAGRIEAVGKNITQFQPGDEVFGRRAPNGFAEYVCISERPIALKPANVSFEQAASVPVAGLTALQSLRDTGKLQPGQTVLINGASGGLGTFSVQVAKALGAHVTGVCSTSNLDLVRSLGADRVIDYTRTDFSREGQRYDLILDNVGNHSLGDYRRTLKPAGRCVITGFTSFGLLAQYLIVGGLVSKLGSQQIGMMISKINTADMNILKELIEAGKLVPFVDKVYPLNEVVEAFRYLETKHARGKVVVTFQP